MAARATRVPQVAARVFKTHLTQLKQLVDRRGVGGLRDLYEASKSDLERRLRTTGPGSERATPTVLRAMQAQADGVLSIMGTKLEDHLRDVGSTAVSLGARHGLDEFKRLEKSFRGTEPTLDLERASVFEGMVAGTTSSLLRRYRRRSRAWSLSAIDSVEREMALHVMTGRTLDETVDRLMQRHGIVDRERYRAERIVRTETAYAHGASKHESLLRLDEELNGPRDFDAIREAALEREQEAEEAEEERRAELEEGDDEDREEGEEDERDDEDEEEPEEGEEEGEEGAAEEAEEPGEEPRRPRRLQKRLIATFDDRTGDDSFLVQGQTTDLDKPFSWKHLVAGEWVVDEYMHPPNRPNDREVLIPWDPEWGDGEEDFERPLTIEELESAEPTRWRKHPGVEIPPGHEPGRPYED